LQISKICIPEYDKADNINIKKNYAGKWVIDFRCKGRRIRQIVGPFTGWPNGETKELSFKIKML